MSDDTARLYIDLMKRCLTNYIYGDRELMPFSLASRGPKRWIGAALGTVGLDIVSSKPFDADARDSGRDFPPTAHTMIGMKRLDNIEACMRTVLSEGIAGDFIETGVWRGGASIFMRAVLEAYGVDDRTVWVADSFRGLPAPDADRYPADAGDRHHRRERLSVSIEEVRGNFSRYGLLDDQVRFLEGWFRDTLPRAPIESLALMRLDGDMYESTMDALTCLYPKLSRGGYVIVDDYGAIGACRKAVEDFRAERGIEDEIVEIDWAGAYWRRSA